MTTSNERNKVAARLAAARAKESTRLAAARAEGATRATVVGTAGAAPCAEGASRTIVPKPWGYELIWAKTDRYVGKILHVRAGEALSLQYHRVKDETIMVLAGRLQLETFDEGEPPSSQELGPGAPFHIYPGLRHRMTALEDTDVLEVSTPELDDVVRLEDRYGRTGQT